MVVNKLAISFVLSFESCIIVNLVPEECWHLNVFTVNFISKRLSSLFCKYNVYTLMCYLLYAYSHL